MNRRIFNLEIRCLVEEPAPQIYRVQALEVDQFVIVSDWERGIVLLHDTIEQQCKDGEPLFREAGGGLAMAWEQASIDETVSDCHGLVYRGALARAVHVCVEREGLVEA